LSASIIVPAVEAGSSRFEAPNVSVGRKVRRRCAGSSALTRSKEAPGGQEVEEAAGVGITDQVAEGLSHGGAGFRGLR